MSINHRVRTSQLFKKPSFTSHPCLLWLWPQLSSSLQNKAFSTSYSVILLRALKGMADLAHLLLHVVRHLRNSPLSLLHRWHPIYLWKQTLSSSWQVSVVQCPWPVLLCHGSLPRSSPFSCVPERSGEYLLMTPVMSEQISSHMGALSNPTKHPDWCLRCTSSVTCAKETSEHQYNPATWSHIFTH